MRAVITVAGKDRVGIIASVTQTLAQQNVNVLDITQTILPPDFFTMVMLVDAGAAKVPFGELPTRCPLWATRWAWSSGPSGRTPSRPCTGSEEGEPLS